MWPWELFKVTRVEILELRLLPWCINSCSACSHSSHQCGCLWDSNRSVLYQQCDKQQIIKDGHADHPSLWKKTEAEQDFSYCISLQLKWGSYFRGWGWEKLNLPETLTAQKDKELQLGRRDLYVIDFRCCNSCKVTCKQHSGYRLTGSLDFASLFRVPDIHQGASAPGSYQEKTLVFSTSAPSKPANWRLTAGPGGVSLC